MSTPTPADVLAKKLTGENPETEEVVDPEAEIEATEEVAEESEETDSEESTESESELPDNIKEILAKNRKIAREAEAREAALKAELEKLKKDTEKPAEETEAPADDRYKKLFVNTAAKSALVEAGLSSGTERFLKMLDLDAVDVDDEGNITGLTDQVSALTEEFADLVVPKEPAPTKKTVKSDAAGRRETPVVPKTSAELLAERMKAK